MSKLNCIVLAAGKGIRMKTNKPKVLSEVLFEPMLGWVLDSVCDCGIKDICVVLGYKYNLVMDFLNKSGYNCEIAMQSRRCGTAHAIKCASEFLKRNEDNYVLILNGDSPFIDRKTIMSSFDYHKKNKNVCTIITTELDNPEGYGRILRDDNENVCAIVEEREACKETKQISEINSGAYWFNISELLKYLELIKKSYSGEYYLTSIVKLFIDAGLKVGTYKVDAGIVLGANTPEQLENLNNLAKINIISKLEEQGIHIPCKDNVTIGKNVEIGEGTMILQDVEISGKTKIGKNCVIGPNTIISEGEIEDNAKVIFLDLNANHNNDYSLINSNSNINQLNQ
ncbi:MAG: NTP transferase domain-containing protein [Candidatus Improbicoccus pseudotrichonymphae]|uniref:NTP transferase domain-containing protein n=1 Tax=Candidatus Improbicoccus pseudotrichonymphae TaxID=3033792 RepID=A0AA48KYR9_9FIRM|nr:MAG: NTP transferase domain-containing protein [Candidatus Improbicoccus pseudotrichonymphae]